MLSAHARVYVRVYVRAHVRVHVRLLIGMYRCNGTMISKVEIILHIPVYTVWAHL